MKLPNTIDQYTTFAQIVLSVLYLFGLFVVIILYELGFARLTKEQEESFSTFVNFLTAGGLIILYFWFQRARTTSVTPVTPPPQSEDPNQPVR